MCFKEGRRFGSGCSVRARRAHSAFVQARPSLRPPRGQPPAPSLPPPASPAGEPERPSPRGRGRRPAELSSGHEASRGAPHTPGAARRPLPAQGGCGVPGLSAGGGGRRRLRERPGGPPPSPPPSLPPSRRAASAGAGEAAGFCASVLQGAAAPHPGGEPAAGSAVEGGGRRSLARSPGHVAARGVVNRGRRRPLPAPPGGQPRSPPPPAPPPARRAPGREPHAEPALSHPPGWAGRPTSSPSEGRGGAGVWSLQRCPERRGGGGDSPRSRPLLLGLLRAALFRVRGSPCTSSSREGGREGPQGGPRRFWPPSSGSGEAGRSALGGVSGAGGLR